ncbi:MAG: alpha/beta family hydrolase [Candidatus Thermoplasmatota archaeon]
MVYREFKGWLLESRWRQAGFVILVVVILIVSSFLVWALTPQGPMDEALEALESDDEVEVSTGDRYIFEPVGEEPEVGFIIYPGARVDPRSYAPAAREIASEGSFVVIEPMRLNLAVFSADAAEEVMEEYPEVERWVVGGHSLGGAMAARFASQEDVDGLVLWASYPPDDLSDSEIPALSIYAELDGLTTVEDVEDTKDKMPPETRYVMIEGGNHAQFGWYGSQRGDNEAEITREVQQSIVVEETVKFLRRI